MSLRALFIASAKSGPELMAGTRDCEKIYRVLRKHGDIDEDLSPAPLLDCPDDSTFIAAINDFFKRSASADQRIVYFTGHGRVSHGHWSLVFDGAHDLPFSSITGLLTGKGPAKTLFILDACHSGAAELGGIKASDALPGIAGAGSCVFASSTDIQVSIEDEDLGSLFTHFLCECIETGNGHVPTSEGVISISDASTYVRERLEARDRGAQTPRYSIRNAEGPMWIARNKSGRLNTLGSSENAASSREDGTRLPCDGATIADLDRDLVTSYAERYLGDASGQFDKIVRKLDLFFSPADERPNEAAILCFGLRPERFFPNISSQFSAGDRASDKFTRRSIDGPIVGQLERLLERTLDHLDGSASFGASALRSDETEIPFNVLREVISNALAHRDLTGEGRVHVHVADEHVDITNPGRFPEGHGWDVLLEHPGASLTPNRRIANHLEKMGAYEGMGRGFSVLKRYREDRGIDAVQFVQRGNLVTCRLKRNRNHDLRQSAIDEARRGRVNEFLRAQSRAFARVEESPYGAREGVSFDPTLVSASGETLRLSVLADAMRKPGRWTLLTGAAGSGKSHALRFAAQRLTADFMIAEASGQKHEAPIPLLLPLRALRTDMSALPAVALAAGAEPGVVEHMFATHPVSLLCDGMDEVEPIARDAAVRLLREVADGFPRSSLLISSRPIEEQPGYLPAHATFELGGLSDGAIEAVLSAAQGDALRRFASSLLPSQRDVFRNPLMLKLLVDTHEQYATPFDGEESFLNAAVEMLLHRHDAAKGVYRRGRRSSLGSQDIRSLLASLALIMVIQRRSVVDEPELAALLSRSFDLTGIARSNTHDVIADLLESGFLLHGEQGFAFMHRPIMEHLATVGVSSLVLDVRRFASLLISILEWDTTSKLPGRMTLSWLRSPQQAQDLIQALAADVAAAPPATKGAVERIIDAIRAERRLAPGRNQDILDFLKGDD